MTLHVNYTSVKKKSYMKEKKKKAEMNLMEIG